MIVLLTVGLLLAGADDNVEWAGVSHIGHADRRPLCPVAGETFSVRFQTFRFDITAARVRVTSDVIAYFDATFVADRGPYAIWEAQLPATGPAASFSYLIELTDGTDTDYLSPAGMSEDLPADAWSIDYTTLVHAPIGATPATGGTVFKVWAPSRSTCHVRGDFNNWSLADPLLKVGEHFVGFAANALPGQEYKFFFNNNKWNTDARARQVNPIDNLNSVIIDPFAYPWGDADFTPPPFEELVIYEMHVGTFAGRNDPVASGAIPATYADVAAHVDHFVELGVNAVELTPINEFPFDFSAGYNPITMFAPEWKYGDPDDLKHMIDVLHQNGIAVIVDIVWNHFSPTDNFMWNYDGSQLYFDSPAIDTPWGAQADFDQAGVRDYFIDSLVLWLEEYHIDGIRMDATEFMDIQSSGWGLMQRMNDLFDNRYADKLSSAEQLPDDPWITRPTDLGGAGFDAQWHDRFTDDLRQEIFDAAFGDPEMWKIAGIINGSGTYLNRTSVINYLELHDEAWPSSGGQRMVVTIDPSDPHDSEFARGRTMLGQGIVATAPGIPMVLQGSEWLESTDFGGGSAAGADRIDWSKKETYSDVFDYYSDLYRIRRTNGALRANAGHQIIQQNESGNVIAWQRFDLDGNVLLIVANFSNNDYTNYRVGAPAAGRWYELLNSQAAGYGGNGLTNCGSVDTTAGNFDGQPQSIEITVPRMGLLVLRHNEPPDDFLDADGDTLVDACDDQNAVPGDLNCDGTVSVGDINPFVLALTDPAGYADAFPDCDALNGDCSDDGQLTVGDINCFVTLITGG